MKKATISIIGKMGPGSIGHDGFELMTDGVYSQEDGVSTISYRESQLTGYDGHQAVFSVEADRVILSRGGGQIAAMIFCEKQKHNFLYETPFGSVTMGIDTHSIKKNLGSNGGDLEIVYDIEMDNMPISRNEFKIAVIAQ